MYEGRCFVESYNLDKVVEINKVRNTVYMWGLRGSYLWGLNTYVCRTGRQGGGRPGTW